RAQNWCKIGRPFVVGYSRLEFRQSLTEEPHVHADRQTDAATARRTRCPAATDAVAADQSTRAGTAGGAPSGGPVAGRAARTPAGRAAKRHDHPVPGRGESVP